MGKSKKTLLKESEKKLEEMHYRKRIVEGMVMRATEQLTAARRSLSEHRKQPNLVGGEMARCIGSEGRIGYVQPRESRQFFPAHQILYTSNPTQESTKITPFPEQNYKMKHGCVAIR